MTKIQEMMRDQMTKNVLKKEMRRTRKATVAQIMENKRLTAFRRAIEDRIEARTLGEAA